MTSLFLSINALILTRFMNKEYNQTSDSRICEIFSPRKEKLGREKECNYQKEKTQKDTETDSVSHIAFWHENKMDYKIQIILSVFLYNDMSSR